MYFCKCVHWLTLSYHRYVVRDLIYTTFVYTIEIILLSSWYHFELYYSTFTCFFLESLKTLAVQSYRHCYQRPWALITFIVQGHPEDYFWKMKYIRNYACHTNMIYWWKQRFYLSKSCSLLARQLAQNDTQFKCDVIGKFSYMCIIHHSW